MLDITGTDPGGRQQILSFSNQPASTLDPTDASPDVVTGFPYPYLMPGGRTSSSVWLLPGSGLGQAGTGLSRVLTVSQVGRRSPSTPDILNSRY